MSPLAGPTGARVPGAKDTHREKAAASPGGTYSTDQHATVTFASVAWRLDEASLRW